MSYPTEASDATGNESPAVALLGLSPLLVLATSVVDALVLAIAAFAALASAGVVIVSIRRWITESTLWPASVLAIGLCTSTIMLLLQAVAFEPYLRITLLVPIVITNWFVLACLGERTQRGPFGAIEIATTAFGAAAVLVIVGTTCEAIGHGTLLAGLPAIEALPAMGDLQIRFADSGFPLAAMPPGAFIIAGLLLAARNATRQRT